MEMYYDLDAKQDHIDSLKEETINTVNSPTIVKQPMYPIGRIRNSSSSKDTVNFNVVVAKESFRDCSTPKWAPRRVIIKTGERTFSTIAWTRSQEENSLPSSSYVVPLSRNSNNDLSMVDDRHSDINHICDNRYDDSPCSSSSQMDEEAEDGSCKQQTFRVSLELGKPARSSGSRIRVFPNSTNGQFPCPHEGCSAMLKSQTALRKHRVVHAAKNFHCDQCDKSFAEQTKLKRHYITHSGERPFKCNFDDCTRAFALECNLKSHIKTHIGDKPHKCSECHFAFTHPYNLKVHMFRRHPEINNRHD